MSDLHGRLLAAVNARLELAHKATPGPWSTSGPDTIAQWEIYDHQWSVASATAYDHNDPLSNKPGATGPAYINADANAAFIAANDPATVIRHCERDLRVLGMHQWRAPGVNCGCDKAMCSCGEHVPWPCEELVWLAEAYAVPIDSALAAPRRLERGGSPSPPR